MNLEERLDALLNAGELQPAAAMAVEGYGPEVLGFLVTLLRDEHDANEAFSQACEDLWVGLSRFEARSSLRVWFYSIARHAASRLRRSPHRRRDAHLPPSELEELAEQVRTKTLPHLRTSVKDRFALIRDALSEDDRALLVLRVDRSLSWQQIATIFSVDDLSEENLTRVGARLRKRFQAVKEEIRERAREAGVLPDQEP
jgi:RNA polymerase sigma-70 factor (ECF subfamily)